LNQLRPTRYESEMQLTPEQQEQVRQAKAGGERRVYVQLTPAQRKAYQEAVDLELAGKDENIAHCQKIKVAAEQPGFFGDVRRAILSSRPSIGDLAATIGVDPRLLSDFQASEAELPAAALDRLLETLGLRLMQEIPR
jgi:DNA-binding MarR family transcriptional regulator